MRKKLLATFSLLLSLSAITFFTACFGSGHEHEYLAIEVVEATCTEGGYTVYKCECGEVYTGDQVNALGHDYIFNCHINDGTHKRVCSRDGEHVIQENCSGGVASCLYKANCEICGGNYGEKLEHDYVHYNSTDTQHWFECECGEKKAGTTVVHTYVGGICICGKKQVNSSHVHNYSQFKTNKHSHWYECECKSKKYVEKHSGGTYSCTQSAVCSTCDAVYGGHKLHFYVDLNYTDIFHWYACSCGSIKHLAEHSGGQATCTTQAKCDTCRRSYGELTPHDYIIKKSNVSSHWIECSCGEKNNVKNHEFNILKESTYTHWYECECGVKGTINQHDYVNGVCTECGKVK